MTSEHDSGLDLARLPEPSAPEGFMEAVMERTAEVDRERVEVASAARNTKPARDSPRSGLRTAATGLGIGAGVAAEVFVLWSRGWEWVPGWAREIGDLSEVGWLPEIDLGALVLTAGLGIYLVALLAGLDPGGDQGLEDSG